MRVDQNLLLASRALPHADDEEVLVRKPLHEEVAAVAFDRHVDRVDFHELSKPLLELLASRERPQDRLRVVVLALDPRSRVRAFLIFEPAVGVSDLDAVDHFFHVAPAALGRGGVTWNLFCSSARAEDRSK